MFQSKHTYLLLVACLLVLGSKSQYVDCLKYIYSAYAAPTSCQSTSSDLRPINITTVFKVSKNMSWYGADDWTPFLHRDGYLIRDLYNQPNCLCSEPYSGKRLYAGSYYELSIKCTVLSFALVKGDFVYFDVFEHSSHKTAEMAYGITIPGYSTPGDINLSESDIARLKIQAQELRKKRKEAIIQNPEIVAQE